jgi:hypothetical protein
MGAVIVEKSQQSDLSIEKFTQILKWAETESDRMNADVGGGIGDYTKEKYERPDPDFEEYTKELFKEEVNGGG